MATPETTALVAACDALDLPAFRAAMLTFSKELSRLVQRATRIEGLADEAENTETHPGTLQRIEGVERQAYAVTQYHTRTRKALKEIRASVRELRVRVVELEAEVTNPTLPPA